MRALCKKHVLLEENKAFGQYSVVVKLYKRNPHFVCIPPNPFIHHQNITLVSTLSLLAHW